MASKRKITSFFKSLLLLHLIVELEWIGIQLASRNKCLKSKYSD